MLNFSRDKDRKIHVKQVFSIPNIDMLENFRGIIGGNREQNKHIRRIKSAVYKYNKHRFTHDAYINSKLKRFHKKMNGKLTKPELILPIHTILLL